MRSEEEIRKRLRALEIQYAELERMYEAETDHWVRLGYSVEKEDLKTEIETLKWVLGEDENEC